MAGRRKVNRPSLYSAIGVAIPLKKRPMLPEKGTNYGD